MNETEAERYLLSLELFGMHFGLERMRRLMTALGHPERQFESIHVVGTNGKSSTVRMIAAILAHHGVATGAYLSPHLLSFGERIRIGDRDLEPAAFAAAVTRAARAAELVDRVGGGEDPVTQFEALTAAAYSELARREVEVAVIEAGLGGRYDATNVIPSKVQVLTSVGLEHTRWLGPTLTDIAGEKLTVVQDGATLVLGPDLDPAVERVAAAVAAEHRARVVHAGVDPGVEVAAPGTYQRRNFALARAAAEAFLGRLDERTVAAAGADVRVPGQAAGGGGQAADAARRCAQPGRHAGARGVAAAAAGREPATGSWPSFRSSTTRTRPGCCPCYCRLAMRSSSPPARIRAPCLRRLCSPSPPSSAADRARSSQTRSARSRAAASWPVRRES